MTDILKLLEKDAKLTNAQIAAMLDISEEEAAAYIAACEKAGIIKGYRTVVDWQKVNTGSAYAMITLKVVPKSETGFDEIARAIASLGEVESVFLTAGVFDLTVMVKGETIQDIAMFVAKKLSTMDSVTSTSTHFILQKYKETDFLLTEDRTDERSVVV